MAPDGRYSGPPLSRRPTRPLNNARARIFFLAFFIACGLSLIYTFARPAVYRSTASLVISPPKQLSVQTSTQPTLNGQSDTVVTASAGDDQTGAPSSPYVLTEMQRMSSRSVLAGALTRLKTSGTAIASVSRLQSMLSTVPVPGTNIVDLHAEGHDRHALPALLNAWIAAYLGAWRQAYQDTSSNDLEQLQGQVKRLQQQVAAKRQALDDFRSKYGIVSMDSDENEAMATVKGLNKALNDARGAEAQAESNLEALKDSIANGQPMILPDDKAALSSLEEDAVKLREQIRERATGFTPQYMALDPKFRAMKTSLAHLEKQIEAKRRESTQAALTQAQQAVTSTRETVARLQDKLRRSRQSAIDFTTRFAQHKALLGELNQLEGLYSAAQDRLVAVQTGGQSAKPEVSVLDQPSRPDDPIYPKYGRDAAISLGGSLLFGFLAVWFVEFFNRSGQPRRAAFPALQPRIQIANFPAYPGLGAPPSAAPDPEPPRLTHAVSHLPRELSTAEVLSLLEAAKDDGRVVLVALLSGVTVGELAALTWDDIDLEGGVLHLPGGRLFTLADPLRHLLERQRSRAAAAAPLMGAPDGKPLAVSDLEGLIACAAYDAGVGAPADVTAEVLRHTYVAFLVRQGVRLSELTRLVGHIPPSLFSYYGRLSPPGRGLSLGQIELTLPAVASLLSANPS